jgi:small subunit ribosomal protein S21
MKPGESNLATILSMDAGVSRNAWYEGRQSPAKIGHQLQVLVRENNVDQALRLLKKRMQREGIFREMKQRSFYEKPSEKRVREKAEAMRRARKLARKKAQRDGLLPQPKARVRDDKRGRPPRPRAPGATLEPSSPK